MSENPHFTIIKHTVPDYDSNDSPYNQYDVVKVVTGPATGQYLVSTYDGNVEAATPAAKDEGAGLGAWLNFQDEDFDFSDVWTPSYESGVNHEPRVLYTQFGDGYAQRQADGVNHQRLVFEGTFRDITNKEAKSVLSFFEYKGGVGKFKLTLPEPYGIQRNFVARNWAHQFAGYNRNGVTVTFIETFDLNFNETFSLT